MSCAMAIGLIGERGFVSRYRYVVAIYPSGTTLMRACIYIKNATAADKATMLASISKAVFADLVEGREQQG